MIPSLATHPAAYVGASLAIFCGTMFIAATGTKTAVWAWPKVKRWKSPPSLVVVAQGGNSATVELRHHGDPTTWEVRRRILDTRGTLSPDPVLRQCMLDHDGRLSRSVTLKDGECCHAVIARIETSEWSPSWVTVQDVDYDGVRVPDRGVVIEVEIKGTPSIKGGVLRRRFALCRVSDYLLRLEEVE